MKKIILRSLVGLGALLATACNMDYEPYGVILDGTAVESVNDCAQFRYGFYDNIRALATGSYIYNSEMQMDCFIGLVTNGNRLGELNNNTFTTNTSDFLNNWGGLYNAIADVNYFLDRVDNVLNKSGLTDKDRANINRYIAEARFTRAYFYWWLLDHFCPPYNDITKDQNLGLPLALNYNPTADKTTYIGRSTLAETYAQIEKDLQAAYDGLNVYNDLMIGENSIFSADEVAEYRSTTLAVMADYLNTNIVAAMQARLALLKGDYQTAYDKAKEVMGVSTYRLCDRSNYAAMWSADQGPELLFRPLSTRTELGVSSTGTAWIGASDYQADYTVMPWVCEVGANNLYSHETDIRWQSFFATRGILFNGEKINCPVFVKYPGNTALNQTSTSSLLNMAKPFRLSEMYLIAAESAYELNNNEAANENLKGLRTLRISRYQYPSEGFTGDVLRDEIRKERLRELIGEGFRLSDLRRWGLPFDRKDVDYKSADYSRTNEIIVAAGRSVYYSANDYRYVWPIPSEELQVNPQIAAQQNPGY